MPRKRWLSSLSEYRLPKIDPNDRNAVEDGDFIRHVLVDFDELAMLSREVREQLVSDLVDSVRHARAGVKARKRGVSDKALAQQIFLSDVGRALERVGLPTKRWRKQYDNGGGESFLFRLAREVADVADLDLPEDLKLLGQRASRHQYGMMSSIMKEAQEDELAAGTKRPTKSRRRPKSDVP
jgi:hypothetical protein